MDCLRRLRDHFNRFEVGPASWSHLDTLRFGGGESSSESDRGESSSESDDSSSSSASGVEDGGCCSKGGNSSSGGSRSSPKRKKAPPREQRPAAGGRHKKKEKRSRKKQSRQSRKKRKQTAAAAPPKPSVVVLERIRELREKENSTLLEKKELLELEKIEESAKNDFYEHSERFSAEFQRIPGLSRFRANLVFFWMWLVRQDLVSMQHHLNLGPGCLKGLIWLCPTVFCTYTSEDPSARPHDADLVDKVLDYVVGIIEDVCKGYMEEAGYVATRQIAEHVLCEVSARRLKTAIWRSRKLLLVFKNGQSTRKREANPTHHAASLSALICYF